MRRLTPRAACRYGEVCLLNQAFVMNDDLSVKARPRSARRAPSAVLPHARALIRTQAAADALAKQANVTAEVVSFARLMVGEGVERETKDFAAEVAAAAQS